MLTLYSSDVICKAANCSYPNKILVSDEESLKAAVSHDYVGAEYRNNYRSNANFIGSDCLVMDCDNDHSENPDDWATHEDVALAFPGVDYMIHFSRSHNIEKNGKAARPKFHVLFPMDYCDDACVYSDIKKKILSIFPFFDAKALDAARFFFGTSPPEVYLHQGNMNITEFLKEYDTSEECLPYENQDNSVIPEGCRNTTMSRFAGRVIKKYGDTENAYQLFLDKAEKCSPPLEDEELDTIWHSAQRFFAKVSSQENYVAPDVYNDNRSYKPEDYSDVGQAEILKKYFSDELRYSTATHFIRYNGLHWQETEPGARAIAQELTLRQLRESKKQLAEALVQMNTNGTQALLINTSKAKAEQLMNSQQQDVYNNYLAAMEYYKFVVKCRSSKNISAMLKEAQPMLEILPDDLDADPFLLCTPEATYDLRKGLNGAREHSPDDLITKITAVSPSQKGQQIWLDCLNMIFQNDQALIEYVQMICGLAAIGRVYLEALIIAYGYGRNGKSTFWNSISRVLGSYSGNISADTLTVGCRRNIKPEMAEIKSQRLLIASEMQEGSRLNDATVKQLCSTDKVFAEKKYKSPFSFTPCHTLILYTNHLPRVSASDDGIWRRLNVIPFSAKIPESSDIKNYGDYLYENAGESILAWIIEGAEKVIAMDYKLPVPECVQSAIDEYRSQNDWFGNFLDDNCEIGDSHEESSSKLYKTYHDYAKRNNEYPRSTTDFYSALEKAGFERIKKHNKRFIKGVHVKGEFGDFMS